MAEIGRRLLTITLGQHSSPESYLAALNAAGCCITKRAKEHLLLQIFSGEKSELELVAISVSELGFDIATPLRDVFAQARQRGFELCPAEVGPALRLAYKQPRDELLFVAMEPVPDADGQPRIFDVGHGDHQPWLDISGAHMSEEFRRSEILVFMLR